MRWPGATGCASIRSWTTTTAPPRAHPVASSTSTSPMPPGHHPHPELSGSKAACGAYPDDVAEEQELLTIEQLAARTGLTVRNIRSHVTRGLLPSPYLKGRTGYYGPEHVARLQLVTGLQQQGFNLAAITSLVSGPEAASADETIAFYRTALGPWLTESPEVWDEPALAAA